MPRPLDLAAALCRLGDALRAAGRAKHGAGVLFKAPRKLDPHASGAGRDRRAPWRLRWSSSGEHHRRRREGFALTDPGTDLVGALDQTHYCIFCHHQGKDSCAKGLKERDGSFKKSVFGVTLGRLPARGEDLRDA